MASLQVFESALMSAVQTAQSQPAQIPTVCEGVYSAVLLLRLLRAVMLSGKSLHQLMLLKYLMVLHYQIFVLFVMETTFNSVYNCLQRHVQFEVFEAHLFIYFHKLLSMIHSYIIVYDSYLYCNRGYLIETCIIVWFVR